MNILDWAENELNLLDVHNDELQEKINKDILEIIKVFSLQDHSGFSAAYCLDILKKLLDHKPITPITGEDDEWFDAIDEGEYPIQQNKRCSSLFRENYNNDTAYYIDGKVFSDDGGETWFSSEESVIKVKFPFEVPENPEYVILNEK